MKSCVFWDSLYWLAFMLCYKVFIYTDLYFSIIYNLLIWKSHTVYLDHIHSWLLPEPIPSLQLLPTFCPFLKKNNQWSQICIGHILMCGALIFWGTSSNASDHLSCFLHSLAFFFSVQNTLWGIQVFLPEKSVAYKWEGCGI